MNDPIKALLSASDIEELEYLLDEAESTNTLDVSNIVGEDQKTQRLKDAVRIYQTMIPMPPDETRDICMPPSLWDAISGVRQCSVAIQALSNEGLEPWMREAFLDTATRGITFALRFGDPNTPGIQAFVGPNEYISREEANFSWKMASLGLATLFEKAERLGVVSVSLVDLTTKTDEEILKSQRKN